MKYEWDLLKAANNVKKHAIPFSDAVFALDDARAITVRDDSEDEERWVTIGLDALGRLIVVVWTWREENIRLISARPCTKNEERLYSENI